MAKKWNELTEDEQWLIAKAASRIRKKYEYEKSIALEQAEDGYGESLFRVNRAIKDEINEVRARHDVEAL